MRKRDFHSSNWITGSRKLIPLHKYIFEKIYISHETGRVSWDKTRFNLFVIVQYYRPCREIKEDRMVIDAQYGPAITFDMTDLIFRRPITIIWFYPLLLQPWFFNIGSLKRDLRDWFERQLLLIGGHLHILFTKGGLIIFQMIPKLSGQ